MSEHEDLPSVDADARRAQYEADQATARAMFDRMHRPADDFAVGSYTCPECGQTSAMGDVKISGMAMPTFAIYCCGRLIEILPSTEAT